VTAQAFGRAEELLAFWHDELRRELPAGAEVFDAHVHLGTDIDGMRGHLNELIGTMDEYGVDRAFMFCLDEPDRHPAFRAPNDRTLAFAERSQGRLIPFVRLDLNEDPVAEANRCLDAGARGIKLHPRAQKISLEDERLPPVFELAAERRVPILIHGGRGLPPIAGDLHALVERCDGVQLIVAHAGIADMGNLTARFAGMPGVFFDTSTWSAVDLLDFYRQMPPEQIVFASDYPYGRQPNSLLMALRTAQVAGFSEGEMRDLLGRNAARIADGEPALAPSQPKGGDELTQPTILARIHQYLSMATPLMWTRQPDTVGVLGLAINTCGSPSNGYQEETEQIHELIATAQSLWVVALAEDEEAERIRSARLVSRLIHLADVLSVTARA
jgi:predicted TIM-barrel fold metal-dependent hydrolase